MKALKFIMITVLLPHFFYSQNARLDSLKNQISEVPPIHVGFKLGFLTKGIQSIPTGIKTTTGKDVTISAGGGSFYAFDAGYLISKNFDLSLMIAQSKSHFFPRLSNIPGTFNRTLFGGCFSYIIPASNKAFLTFGAGLLYAFNPKLDVDASQVKGGAHNIYTYDNTVATMAQIEYEIFSPKKSVSLLIALQYYAVTYTVDKVTSNGVNIPVSALPQSFDVIKNLNGATLNINVGIAFHFKAQ